MQYETVNKSTSDTREEHMHKNVLNVITAVLILFSFNQFAQEPTSKARPAKKADFDIQAVRDITKGPGKVKFQVQYYIDANHPNPCFIKAYIPNLEYPNNDFVCLPAGGDSQEGIFKGKNDFEDDMALVLRYTGTQPLKSKTIEIVIYDKDGPLNSKIFNWDFTWKSDPTPSPEKKEKTRKTAPVKPGIKPKQSGQVYHYTERKKRYQLEIFGGYASMSPDDFNLRISHDQNVTRFYNDQLYEYQVAQGDILSWDKSQTGEFKEIKNTIPIGIRLKVRLTQSIYLLFGTKFFSSSQISNADYRYTIETAAGTGATDIQYSDYTLKAKGSALMFGIHLEKRIGKSLELNGFIIGGPLYAKTEYGHKYRETDVSGSVINQYDLRVEGSGYGPSVELGAQLGFRLQKRLNFFIEAVYAYLRAKPVSGTGTLNYSAPVFSQQIWDEEWSVNESTTQRYWGTLTSLRPTNKLEAGDSIVRKFIANLSGFQVRAGFSYRF